LTLAANCGRGTGLRRFAQAADISLRGCERLGQGAIQVPIRNHLGESALLVDWNQLGADSRSRMPLDGGRATPGGS